jgi:GNAT superfamily N-acetyltransferase
MSSQVKKLTLQVRPLTLERWPDFERLFGEKGGCGGCWCMWLRLKRTEFVKQQGSGNKRVFKKIVESGETVGLLAYAGTEAVGWCALAPRESFSALERSRVLKRVDDRPVWSVVCFFICKSFRRRGVMLELLRAALRHAESQGARIVEGYPIEARQDRMPDVFAFPGIAAAFRRAGFKEVARRSPTRPIMRAVLGQRAAAGSTS